MNDSGQMANFTIDGKEIEVVPGRNVLMTALDHGVHIPHYCYHPGIERARELPDVPGGD